MISLISVHTGQFNFHHGDVIAIRPHHIEFYVPVRGDQSSHSEKNIQMKSPVWLKPDVWGAVAGAIVMAIVGFSQLGWTTSSTAEKLAQERADTAVVAALVPFCVAKAQRDPDKTMFDKLRAETSSYSRSDMVMKAGWATVGDDKSPDNALARACSDKLTSAKTG